MGITNLLHGLESKYAHWLGELAAKLDEIDRIEKLTETLPALRERTQELRELAGHAASLLKNLKPGWELESVTPVKPCVHQIPIKMGECGRTALEVLREAAEPMTAREIADEVLRRAGIFNADVPTRQKTTGTVLSALRSRRGKIVESDSNWPQRWSVKQA
jgi:hypothetical protein